MSFSKTLLLALLASAALSACSSEPSDWRPDDKVSLDMVEPGTRATQNFDQAAGHAQHGAGDAAHAETTNRNMDIHAAPTADAARSANSVDGSVDNLSKPVIEDTAASGHQIQR